MKSFIFPLVIILLVAGCASKKSIVISNRATTVKIEEGVVYSLPKQLVKVVYTRKPIDSIKAAVAKKKAKEAVDSTTKEINKKKKAEKNLKQLIKNIDPQATNRAELEAKLNL